MSILCLKIWTPLTLCTFSKLTPQNQPFSKIVTPPPPPATHFLRDVINCASDFRSAFVTSKTSAALIYRFSQGQGEVPVNIFVIYFKNF